MTKDMNNDKLFFGKDLRFEIKGWPFVFNDWYFEEIGTL